VSFVPEQTEEEKEADVENPTRRLRQKTSQVGLQEQSKRDVEMRTRVEKRVAPDSLEELAEQVTREEEREYEMRLLEVLACETETSEEQVCMSDGVHWMPASDVVLGDTKEFEGLWKDGVFELADEIPEGSTFIDSRVVRRIKGDAVKSRWVLRDFAHGKAPEGGELYAATPSLGAFRLLVALGSLLRNQKADHCFLIGDVTQAFPHALIDKPIYSTVPYDVDGLVLTNGDKTLRLVGGQIIVLRRALYGYRKSPRLWQDFLVRQIEKCELERTQVEPAIFVNSDGSILVLVHVDDVLISASTENASLVMNQLKNYMKMKDVGSVRKIGDSCSFLGRTIRLTSEGYVIEGSGKIVNAFLEELGVTQCKYTPTPAIKLSQREIEQSELLDGPGHRKFRSILGKLLYVAHDRPDLQYAVKEAARACSAPREVDVQRVKRIGRYLSHHRSLPALYSLREVPTNFCVWVDADWAGDVVTRKSTSGGILTYGECYVSSWSRTQSCVALSSAEAEYYALLQGAQEGLKMKHLACELHIDATVILKSDSSAAKCAAEKRGTLHMKHLALKSLFLKELVATNMLSILKIGTQANAADMLTKPVGQEILRRCLDQLACWLKDIAENSS
jgi:hypothetical protein